MPLGSSGRRIISSDAQTMHTAFCLEQFSKNLTERYPHVAGLATNSLLVYTRQVRLRANYHPLGYWVRTLSQNIFSPETTTYRSNLTRRGSRDRTTIGYC
eukprot:1176824-Prorocentrum_minimum.AAC.6